MATRLNTTQILDETVGREDLNSTTTGKAVVKKIVQGTNITLSSTGVDSGTGDVTISLPSFPWASISGKPNTLNGYGITDGLNKYMPPVTNAEVGSIPYGYPLTRPLYTDPEFNDGYNNLGVYNNSSADGVSYSLITDSQAPNRTKKVLKVESFDGKLQAPGLGGIVPYSFIPTYNTQYIEIFVAKIPTGYYVQGASNSIGTDGDSNIWLTSQMGTGRWETYVRLISAGSTGVFLSTGHIYIQPMSGQTSVTWYVSYFNVFMLNVDASSYISSDQIASLDWNKLINKPTTVAGYGITDVYTKSQIDQMGVTPPAIKSAKLLAPKWYKLFRLNNFQNDFNSAGENVNAVFRVLGQSDFGRTADSQTTFIEGSIGMRGQSFKPILTSKGDLALGQGANRYQFQVFIEDGFAYLYMRTPTYSECVIEYYITGGGVAYITPVADVTFNSTTQQFDVPVPSTGTKYWDSADPTGQYQTMYIGNNPIAVQNNYASFSRLNVSNTNYFMTVRNPLDTNAFLDAFWDTTSSIGIDSSADLNISAPSLSLAGAVIGIYGKLTVSSTDLITNLNADMLDGQDGSYYLDWNNLTNKPTPSGTQGQLQYKDGVTFGAVSNATVEPTGKLLMLTQQTTTPNDPGYGYVLPYARKKAKFGSLGIFSGGNKYNKSAQLSLDEDTMYWSPSYNTTSGTNIGFTAWSVTGTATSRTIATTSPLHRTKRLGIVAAATAGSVTGYRQPFTMFYPGSGTLNMGGFFFISRFGQSNPSVVSGERFFYGLSSSTAAPTNIEPSTLVNSIGLAILSTDSTQYYLIASASTAQPAIPLGTAFGSPSKAFSSMSDIIELAIHSPSNDSTVIYVQATNVTLGQTFEYTITDSSRLPTPSTAMGINTWKTNNDTAISVSYELMYFKAYINT